MSTEQWNQVSRVIDFIMKQPTVGAVVVKGEPPKRQRKPKKTKQEQPTEQLRMF